MSFTTRYTTSRRACIIILYQTSTAQNQTYTDVNEILSYSITSYNVMFTNFHDYFIYFRRYYYLKLLQIWKICFKSDFNPDFACSSSPNTELKSTTFLFIEFAFWISAVNLFRTAWTIKYPFFLIVWCTLSQMILGLDSFSEERFLGC